MEPRCFACHGPGVNSHSFCDECRDSMVLPGYRVANDDSILSLPRPDSYSYWDDLAADLTLLQAWLGPMSMGHGAQMDMNIGL